MDETFEQYLRREMAEFVSLAQRAVAHYQAGPSISTGGVIVTVSPAGPSPLAEFHDRCEKLEAVLKSGLRRGAACGLTGDRRGCPNFEHWDGEETYGFNCDVCGVKGGGEHPQ